MMVEPVGKLELAEIARWREKRGLPEWPEGWLSRHGYWVRGLAAGWLVPTASRRALLEDFVVNPDADKSERSEAMFAVERHIRAEARSFGYRYLIGTTLHESIRSRVKTAGYSVTEPIYSLHLLELANE